MKNLIQVREHISSLKICLDDAVNAKEMKDREAALECMEHDLKFLTKYVDGELEDCYKPDGDLKEIK